MDKVMFGRGDFLEQDPPRHRELRDLVKRWFTTQAMAELEPFVHATVTALIAEIRDATESELLSAFAKPIPLIVFSHLLGLPRNDVDTFERWTDAMLVRVPGEPGIPAEALAAARQVRSYLAGQAKAKATMAGRDILSDIVRAQAHGILDADEVVGMATLLFTAGTATTFGLISNALALLAEHPNQRAALVEDPRLIPAAVEEVIRFESPLQHSFRTTTKSVELSGHAIPSGSRVLLLFGAANRDESRWDDPDRFDIHRPALRNLGFGDGVHHCLGAPLARLEARIAIEEFLAAFSSYVLLGAEGSVGLSTHPTRKAVRVRLC
jgi:cytochrome P450